MRLGIAFAISLLAAAEAAILSAPLGFYLGKQHAPKSEFAGLAVFGEILMVSAISAGIIFAAAFALVVKGDHSPHRLKAILWSLSGAVGTAVLIVALAGRYEDGALWAIGLSAVVLVVGLIIATVVSRPSAID